MDLFAYNTLIVLAGTTLLGTLAGGLGTYLVLRRRALLGDALAHAAFPGIFLAFAAIGSRVFAGLLLGAFLSALLGAWCVGAIRRHTRIKEDAAIGIVLSVLFGLGVALWGIIQNSPTGAKAGLESFIFGKTAGMILQDVYLILGVGLLVLCITLLLHKEFKLVAFDSGFAAVQGWPVLGLDLLMMSLVCVTTIIGLPAVGVVLMAAMLIIPPAAARFWTDRLPAMLALAGGFGLFTGLAGTLASAHYASLPAGPIIILAGAAIFIFSMLFSPKRGVIARLVRQGRLRRRIAQQNLLRTLYELNEPAWPEPRAIKADDLLLTRAWSARRALGQLRSALRRGWVEQVNGERWRLTPQGWQEAARIVRAHRLWEIFLLEEAQAAPALVDRDAEQVEHVLPRPLIDRLEARLRELNLLPRGLEQMPASPHALAGSEAKP